LFAAALVSGVVDGGKNTTDHPADPLRFRRAPGRHVLLDAWGEEREASTHDAVQHPLR
jgi:hypothetical protein